jgi:hypothetical protein
MMNELRAVRPRKQRRIRSKKKEFKDLCAIGNTRGEYFTPPGRIIRSPSLKTSGTDNYVNVPTVGFCRFYPIPFFEPFLEITQSHLAVIYNLQNFWLEGCCVTEESMAQIINNNKEKKIEELAKMSTLEERTSNRRN